MPVIVYLQPTGKAEQRSSYLPASDCFIVTISSRCHFVSTYFYQFFFFCLCVDVDFGHSVHVTC